MQKKPRNQHYQDDIKYMLLLTRNILLAIGVWPSFSKETSIRKRVRNFLLIIISYFMLLCSLLPGVFHWMREKRTRARISMFPMLLYCVMTSSKYGNLIIRQNQIRRCLKHIEEDWKNVTGVNARNLMLESAKIGRRLVMIYAVFLYVSGLTFRVVTPFARGKIVNAQNITIRPLPYPTYLFSIDTQASPLYEILFTIQFLSGLVTVTVASSSCGLVMVFVMHVCGQLKVLMSLMMSFVKQQWQEGPELDKKLADIVEHQIRLRSLLQSVEHTMQQVCFIEMTGVTLMIVVLGYLIIMEWENNNSVAMVSYFFVCTNCIICMFMHCYTGEQLIAEAERVATTSCELEWYRLPNKKARGIVLMMIVSNLPTKLTAGKIMDLSFKTYGDILKSAAAYFNMLRSVVG